MNNYIKAILLFLFFQFPLASVLRGAMTDVGGIVGIEDTFWINIAGGFAGTVMGTMAMIKRVRSDAPWILTPFGKTIVFGFLHYGFQELWLISLSGVGSNGSPQTSANILTAFDYLIRFPSWIFPDKHWALFLSTFFWSAVFFYVISLAEKKKLDAKLRALRGK